jgi:hypothetical protein
MELKNEQLMKMKHKLCELLISFKDKKINLDKKKQAQSNQMKVEMTDSENINLLRKQIQKLTITVKKIDSKKETPTFIANKPKQKPKGKKKQPKVKPISKTKSQNKNHPKKEQGEIVTAQKSQEKNSGIKRRRLQ